MSRGPRGDRHVVTTANRILRQRGHRQVDDVPEHAGRSGGDGSSHSDRRLRSEGELDAPHPARQGAGHHPEPRRQCRQRRGSGNRRGDEGRLSQHSLRRVGRSGAWRWLRGPRRHHLDQLPRGERRLRGHRLCVLRRARRRGLRRFRHADPREQGAGNLHRHVRRDDGDVCRQQHLQGHFEIRQFRRRAPGRSGLQRASDRQGARACGSSGEEARHDADLLRAARQYRAARGAAPHDGAGICAGVRSRRTITAISR